MRSYAKAQLHPRKVPPVPTRIVEHVEWLGRGKGAPAVLVVNSSGDPGRYFRAKRNIEVLLHARKVHHLHRTDSQVRDGPVAVEVPVEIRLVEQQHSRVRRDVQRGVRIADVEPERWGQIE